MSAAAAHYRGQAAGPAGYRERAFRAAGAGALSLLALMAAGCIRSRVVITSEPNQAEVTFNGRPRGATPIEIPIIWYWYYDVKVEKEGYESIQVIERFRTRPWFLMPMDLVAEIIPVPIPDVRHRHYILKRREGGP